MDNEPVFLEHIVITPDTGGGRSGCLQLLWSSAQPAVRWLQDVEHVSVDSASSLLRGMLQIPELAWQFLLTIPLTLKDISARRKYITPDKCHGGCDAH